HVHIGTAATASTATTAARTFFIAYSSPLREGLVLPQASPSPWGHCLPTSSALLYRERPDPVALRCHGTFKPRRTRTAGSEALDEVGAGFACVEGEADGIGLLAVPRKRDIDIQLRDGEGVCDFGWGQGGKGLPVAIGHAPDVSLHSGKGTAIGQ